MQAGLLIFVVIKFTLPRKIFVLCTVHLWCPPSRTLHQTIIIFFKKISALDDITKSSTESFQIKEILTLGMCMRDQV